MPFKVTLTEVAETHFRSLSAREQRMLETAIASRLRFQPMTPTRAVKRLRPNPFAAFELRAGTLRALYNVEGDEVVILVIGRKVGNKLTVEGEEFDVHQDNPTEPSGGELGRDVN